MNLDQPETASAGPLISVCLPMYNNADSIERCIRSIVEQDADFELIVVDDASTDDSVALAEPLLRPSDRLIRNESNLGREGNHEKALNLARGPYIQIVHGDDYLLPGALQTFVRCFDDPSVGLVFSPRKVETDDPTFLEDAGTLHTNFRKLEYRNDGLTLVRELGRAGFSQNWIGEPTNVMFRHSILIQAGGVHKSVAAGDLELWLRLLLRSAACFTPQELSVRCQRVITPEALRQYWLDHIQILTWMIADPASPLDIKLTAAAWWPVAWLGQAVNTLINGPERWSRLKVLAAMPIRELFRARRLRHRCQS